MSFGRAALAGGRPAPLGTGASMTSGRSVGRPGGSNGVKPGRAGGTGMGACRCSVFASWSTSKPWPSSWFGAGARSKLGRSTRASRFGDGSLDSDGSDSSSTGETKMSSNAPSRAHGSSAAGRGAIGGAGRSAAGVGGAIAGRGGFCTSAGGAAGPARSRSMSASPSRVSSSETGAAGGARWFGGTLGRPAASTGVRGGGGGR